MKNKVFKKIETAKYRPLQLHSLQQQPSTENSDKILTAQYTTYYDETYTDITTFTNVHEERYDDNGNILYITGEYGENNVTTLDFIYDEKGRLDSIVEKVMNTNIIVIATNNALTNERILKYYYDDKDRVIKIDITEDDLAHNSKITVFSISYKYNTNKTITKEIKNCILSITSIEIFDKDYNLIEPTNSYRNNICKYNYNNLKITEDDIFIYKYDESGKLTNLICKKDGPMVSSSFEYEYYK